MLLPNNENELDKLIREAEDKYHPTGKPDWEVMQTLLDKHMPVKKKPGRRAAFLLILLLTFLLGSTFFYFLKTDDKKSNPVKDPPAITESVHRKLAPAIIQPENKPAIKIQQTQTPTLQNHSTIQQQQASTINKHRLTQYHSKANSKIKTGIVAVEENYTPQKIKGNSIAADKSNDPTANDLTTALLPTESGIGDINNKAVDTSVAPRIASSQNKIIPEANDGSSDKKKAKALNRKQRLEITLLYAPELTTIKFSNIDKPGSNYGLLIGYPLSKNFTIQTGIVRSRKNYIANGEDFPNSYSTGSP